MQKFFIQSGEKGTRLFLNGQEIQNVLEFNLKSETSTIFQLTVKINVELSRMSLGDQVGDHLSGNLGKDTE